MAAGSDIGFRQKAVIEFLSNEGTVPKEISERLKNVFAFLEIMPSAVRQLSGGSYTLTVVTRK